MIRVRRKIETLEKSANDAELLSYLARNAESRINNRLVADGLREDAVALRRQVHAILPD